MYFGKTISIVAGFMIAGTMAQAAGPANFRPEATKAILPPITAPVARWEVILGAGAVYKPIYEGSDEMDISPFPFLSLRYGKVSFGPDGLGLKAWSTDQASLGIYLGYGGGRDPQDVDSGALDGFEKIDDAAILGGEFNYTTGIADVFVGLEKYLGKSDGTSLELGLRRKAEISDRLSVFASGSATISDNNYMDRYFGVTARDASASGYQVYEAGAGLRRVDISVGGTYVPQEQWMLRGEIGVGKLLGDANDSPIVLDDIQPGAMLAVGFRF